MHLAFVTCSFEGLYHYINYGMLLAPPLIKTSKLFHYLESRKSSFLTLYDANIFSVFKSSSCIHSQSLMLCFKHTAVKKTNSDQIKI